MQDFLIRKRSEFSLIILSCNVENSADDIVFNTSVGNQVDELGFFVANYACALIKVDYLDKSYVVRADGYGFLKGFKLVFEVADLGSCNDI